MVRKRRWIGERWLARREESSRSAARSARAYFLYVERPFEGGNESDGPFAAELANGVPDHPHQCRDVEDRQAGRLLDRLAGTAACWCTRGRSRRSPGAPRPDVAPRPRAPLARSPRLARQIAEQHARELALGFEPGYDHAHLRRHARAREMSRVERRRVHGHDPDDSPGEPASGGRWAPA